MEFKQRATPYHPRDGAHGVSIPHVVAHRGFAENYPENTLIALVQALKCGVSYIEFDVQLTADGKPVVFHDPSLDRTTDVDKNILDITYAEAKTYQACETKRFGQEFVNMGIAIPALADIVYTLKSWPQATAFVEIKEESLKKHGIERTIKTVMQTVQRAGDGGPTYRLGTARVVECVT
ncbi:MAG: glycerophosphoryl diester phosphodiesterase [Halothiobacillaceae bacterium]|nr:MAG: glycerophosphoryl diester phosphodiesterase [Halothiobacillaceae bacterium]